MAALSSTFGPGDGIDEDDNDEYNEMGFVDDDDEKNEQQLEDFLFGKTTSNLVDKKIETETNIGAADDDDVGLLSFCISTKPINASEKLVPMQLARKSRIRKPAWADADDTEINVNIQEAPRLRKLRKTEDEQILPGNKFQERLKTQFEKAVGSASWADFDQKCRASTDSESENEILCSSRDVLASSEALEKTFLNITRVKDLNASEEQNASITCTEFHPSERIALTASLNKKLDLFQVDGQQNKKIQGIFVHNFPIYTAHFLSSGDKVILSSRRKHYFYYDMISGKVIKVPGIRGHDEKSLEDFVLSPDGELIAFYGSSGYLHLISARSYQWITSLKMNGSLLGATFTADSSRLFSVGGDGEVYIWDMKSRRCLHRFVDDGSIRSSCVAISSDDKYVAVGSSCGVVNIYDQACISKKHPTPVKTVKNLTTYIRNIKFNSTNEILSISSRAVKDAFRMLHVDSHSVFGNWPTSRSPLGHVQCMDFSPSSGHLAVGNSRGKVLLYRLSHYQDYLSM